jgi:hypothetical protein
LVESFSADKKIIDISADTSLGDHTLTFALYKAVLQISLVTSWTKRTVVIDEAINKLLTF